MPGMHHGSQKPSAQREFAWLAMGVTLEQATQQQGKGHIMEGCGAGAGLRCNKRLLRSGHPDTTDKGWCGPCPSAAAESLHPVPWGSSAAARLC